MTITKTRVRLRTGIKVFGLGLLGAALIGGAVGAAETATAQTATTHAAATRPATVVKVLRPVTASGHLAKGWLLIHGTEHMDNCSYQSPWAVDKHIAVCGADYLDAQACWKSATGTSVLCVSPYDLQHHQVRSFPYTGLFTTRKGARDVQPLLLHMRNGMVMGAREGGAWSRLKQHPSWNGYFYQLSKFNHTIYAPSSEHSGLDQKSKAWSGVLYGSTDKAGKTAYVATAYFVGTAS